MGYFNEKVQPFVRAFIVSDAMLYSGLNLINLLFVVYVTTVAGGTETAAFTAIAAGLITRIIVELTAGRLSSRLSERGKLALIIGGMAAISISYAGFAFTHNIYLLGVLWVLNGAGWALAHPAKLALAAKYINHGQASQEWGFTDALNMTLVVVTMAVGAFILDTFSYGLLFMLAAAINTVGILPFVWYARAIKKSA